MKLNGISKETMEDIHRFVHERDWEQFHTPKDLAISLSLEAAELLEIFQWSGTDMQCRDKLPHMKEEIAESSSAMCSTWIRKRSSAPRWPGTAPNIPWIRPTAARRSTRN